MPKKNGKDNLKKKTKDKKKKENKYKEFSKAPEDTSHMKRARKTPMGKGRSGY